MERKYGYIKDKEDKRDFVYKLDLTRFPIAPKSDLREQCPPVYDQLNIGSCTGNGIAGAIQFDFKKQNHPDYVPSRLFIYYNERRLEHTIHEDAGAMIRDGIKATKRWGACPEKEWPYLTWKFDKRPSCKCYRIARNDKITKYERLVSFDSYLSVLSQGYPIVFGFTVFESFSSSAVANTGITPMPKLNEQILGGHCVLMVGHNNETRQILCRNSWGSDWGIKGYFWLPYEYFTAVDKYNDPLTADFWVIYTVL